MECFVINLPKDIERKTSITKELQQAGIEFSFIEAIHGAELMKSPEGRAFYDEKKAIKIRHRQMTAGEIGCALSHIKAYREMLAKNLPYAVVMEDDVHICEENLKALLPEIKNLYDSNRSVIILLSHVGRYISNKNDTPLGQTHKIHDYYRGGNGDCYVITRAAAKHMLENLFPVYTVFDKWEFYKGFVDVKAIVPYCAYQKDFASSIEEIGMRSLKMRENRIRNVSYYIKHYTGLIANFFRRLTLDIRKQPW